MDTALLIVVLLVAAAWVYNAGHRTGKREGSRKAYGVGFRRGRRSRGPSGCLAALLACAAFLAAAAAALACLR